MQSLSLQCSFRIPSGTDFVYFAALLCGAALFFFLAFFVFLPMLVIAPSKFALSFTCGSICTMAAMLMLSGWKAGMAHMVSPDRLPFTAIYLGSMAATLYAAVSMRSYILSLGFSVVQVCPSANSMLCFDACSCTLCWHLPCEDEKSIEYPSHLFVSVRFVLVCFGRYLLVRHGAVASVHFDKTFLMFIPWAQ
jgi:hypothetical protein